MIRFLLLSALAAAGAQSPPAAVIEGSVTEAGTGKPLARCTVTLEAVLAGMALPRLTTLSESSGRFAFSGLQPGAYRVRAQRAGFLPGYFGGRSASPVIVESGSRFAAAIRLERAGAISGEVFDENQVGLPGVGVQAFTAGVLPLQLVSNVVTDDCGEFRLAGLAPGRYWVRTSARELEDRQGILPTFLGQTTRAANATVVTVEGEADVAAGSIQPVFGHLGRLEGRVSGGAAFAVILFTDSGKRELAPDSTGRFTFEQLAPGTYELIANSTSGLVGWGRVQVGEGTTTAAVPIGPMPTVSVRTQPEARVIVRLKRLGDSEALPAPPAISGSVQAIFPGEYAAVALAPPGMYIVSIEPKRFTVGTSESAELSVVLSSHPGRISGKVSLAGGAPAAAVPVFLQSGDPDVVQRMGGARRTLTDEGGQFAFADLPPGTFTVFSALGVPEGLDPDPGLYPGRTITVEEGSSVTIDLELTPPK